MQEDMSKSFARLQCDPGHLRQEVAKAKESLANPAVKEAEKDKGPLSEASKEIDHQVKKVATVSEN